MKRAVVGVVALVAACGAPQEPRRAIGTTSDAQFRAGAIAFGKRTHRTIHSWGLVKLDGEHVTRFVQLQPDVLESRGESRGAYVLELAPGRVVAVTFIQAQETQVFGGDRVDGEPALVTNRELAAGIEVATAVPYGSVLWFGVDKGVLAVFAYDDHGAHPDEDRFPKPRWSRVNGACTPSCPKLDKFFASEIEPLVGPEAATPDALAEPPVPPPEVYI